MMNSDDRDDKDLSDEDEALWAYVTRGIKPIAREAPKSAQPPDKKEQKRGVKTDHKTVAPSELRRTEDIQHDRQPPGLGLDRRSDRRLKRGQMPIEARLDLHGMTRSEARRALENFLGHAYENGKRCVLVITGKGTRRRSDDDDDRRTGILRESLPAWLSEGAAGSLVLRYHTARPQHGGEGAFYILLRRKRQG